MVCEGINYVLYKPEDQNNYSVNKIWNFIWTVPILSDIYQKHKIKLEVPPWELGWYQSLQLWGQRNKTGLR